jgi:hypothetical protein
MWWYLGTSILAFLGLGYVIVHKAIAAGDCSLPDDDGEDYP